jgi:FRG domain
MYEHEGKKWEDFAGWLVDRERDRQTLKDASGLHVSELLFRGQPNACWKLQTTLERHEGGPLEAVNYYQGIHAAKAQLESYTGQHWKIPTPHEYIEFISPDSPGFELWDMPQQVYEYLVYLRHHGFPSPLFDWSASPYVAAFFAFNQARIDVERVAIYGYLEYTGQGKMSTRQLPTIRSRGPYVSSHRRHFLQQSRYTQCIQLVEGSWKYASHEDAFINSDGDSDLLWKFTLPSSERIKVLKELQRFNLNAFSLFGSEESLMEAVAMDVFNFGK